MSAKWGWGRGHAKSWGNGIIRVSLKDAIAVLMAAMAMYGAWRDLKNAVNANMAMDAGQAKDIAQIRADQAEIKDRVLVLETVAKTTQAKVVHLSRAPMLSPGVVKITRAR